MVQSAIKTVNVSHSRSMPSRGRIFISTEALHFPPSRCLGLGPSVRPSLRCNHRQSLTPPHPSGHLSKPMFIFVAITPSRGGSAKVLPRLRKTSALPSPVEFPHFLTVVDPHASDLPIMVHIFYFLRHRHRPFSSYACLYIYIHTYFSAT